MGSQRDILRGRVAVVTGSTRGLGLAMARLLGHQGATVVLASRSDVDVAAAVERLHAEGIAVSGRRCDTGELADVEAGKGLAGGLLRDESLKTDMKSLMSNLTMLSSNLNKYGLLYKPPQVKTTSGTKAFPYEGKH